MRSPTEKRTRKPRVPCKEVRIPDQFVKPSKTCESCDAFRHRLLLIQIGPYEERIQIMKRWNLWRRDLEKRRQHVPYVLGGMILALTLAFTANAAKPVTDPAEIAALAAEAYIWGLGPEYIERFSKYNTIIGAPFNALTYESVPAAWNNYAALLHNS